MANFLPNQQRFPAGRPLNGFWFFLTNPFAATATATVLVVATILATLQFHTDIDRKNGNPLMIPESYQVVLEPEQTARMMISDSKGFESLAEKPALSRESFEKALFWIEKEVKLDTAQVVKFKQVHERFFTRYELLCSQLIHLENEYRQFERARIAGETVDLFSVYSNFQQQKSIYQQTIKLQQGLIQEVSTLLTPQQQGAYGQLFNQAPNPPQNPPSARMEYPTREWQI